MRIQLRLLYHAYSKSHPFHLLGLLRATPWMRSIASQVLQGYQETKITVPTESSHPPFLQRIEPRRSAGRLNRPVALDRSQVVALEEMVAERSAHGFP